MKKKNNKTHILVILLTLLSFYLVIISLNNSYEKEVKSIIAIVMVLSQLAILALIVWVIKTKDDKIKKISEAKNQLDFITSKIQGGVIVNSLEDGLPIIYVNDGACNLTGYSSDEFVSKYSDEFVYEKDRDKYNSIIYKIANNHVDEYEMEYRIKKKDGNLLWVLERGSIVENEKGKKKLQTVFFDIQKQKDFERELMVKEDLYEVAVKIFGLSMFEYDVLKKEVSVYKNSKENKGLKLKETQPLLSAINSWTENLEYRSILEECYRKIDEGENTAEAITKQTHSNGKEMIMSTKLVSILDNGKPIRAIGVVSDVTTLHILKNEQEITELLKSDTDLTWKVNVSKNILKHGNIKWLEGYGIELGMDCDKIISKISSYAIHPEDRQGVVNSLKNSSLLELFTSGILNLTIEYRRLLTNGTYVWTKLQLKTFKDTYTDNIMAVGYTENINERKLNQLELLNKAEHDGLTGMYNRETAKDMVTDYLKTSANNGYKSAFIIFDIDYFKNVNDKFGHVSGDKVLKKISDTVKSLCREDDILSRIGGDEFIVFMKNISDETTVMIKAREMVQTLNYYYKDNGEEMNISISMGIAFSSSENNTYETLYESADKALYKAKGNGRNGYSVFGSEIDDFGVGILR
ncbi:diguanylate cyclase [Clostridium sp.]|uniref:GGDEF domain-containing protein n=1 Tax=Clostridium sp. TaxID=1506 RepID=UPI003216EEDB